MSRIIFEIAGKPVVDFDEKKQTKYKTLKVYILNHVVNILSLIFLFILFLNTFFNLAYFGPLTIVFGVIVLILFGLKIFWGGIELLEKSLFSNLFYISTAIFIISLILGPKLAPQISFTNQYPIALVSYFVIIFLIVIYFISSHTISKLNLKVLSFGFLFLAILKIILDIIYIIQQLRIGQNQQLTFDSSNFYWYGLFVISFAYLLRLKLKRFQTVISGLLLWVCLFFLALSLRVDSMWVMFLSIAITLTYIVIRNFKQIYKNIKLFFKINTDRTIVSLIIEIILIGLMILLLFGASKLFFQQLNIQDLSVFYTNLNLKSITFSNLLYVSVSQNSMYFIPALLGNFGLLPTLGFIISFIAVPLNSIIKKKENYDLLLLTFTFVSFGLLILPFNEILIIALSLIMLMCKTKFVFNS